MNQVPLLTALGCSGSLAATVLFGQAALATPDAAPTTLAGYDVGAITQIQAEYLQAEHLPTAELGYTSDDSLTDALGCLCALCNPNRDRPTTAPIQ